MPAVASMPPMHLLVKRAEAQAISDTNMYILCAFLGLQVVLHVQAAY